MSCHRHSIAPMFFFPQAPPDLHCLLRRQVYGKNARFAGSLHASSTLRLSGRRKDNRSVGSWFHILSFLIQCKNITDETFLIRLDTSCLAGKARYCPDVVFEICGLLSDGEKQSCQRLVSHKSRVKKSFTDQANGARKNQGYQVAWATPSVFWHNFAKRQDNYSEEMWRKGHGSGQKQQEKLRPQLLSLRYGSCVQGWEWLQ